MPRAIGLGICAALLLLSDYAIAAEKQDPYLCRDRGQWPGRVPEIKKELEHVVCNKISLAQGEGDFTRACLFATKAEIYKRDGKYEAEACYQKAIQADPTEPAYELFYADYLRNFRGTGVPLQRFEEIGSPLIPRAQEHYVRAQRKLFCLARKSGRLPGISASFRKWLDDPQQATSCGRDGEAKPVVAEYRGDDRFKTEDRRARYLEDTYRNIKRGLADLYQRDGQALPPSEWDANRSGQVEPLLFFSSLNEFAQSTTDFGRVDDARSFTSEAQFAESPVRLNRKLSRNELQSIARDWLQVQTVNKLRFRNGEWPSIDAFFAYQHGDNEQIENFFEPTQTTDITLKEFGFALEKPFDLAPIMDASIGAGYKRVRRDGIVEFRPGKTETINEFSVDGAGSRFVGPNKLTLNGTFTYQDIEPNSVVAGGANSGDHDRYIYGATLSYLAPYLLPKPISGEEADPLAQLYETRGVKFFTGFAHDFEAFGTTDIEEHDYFIGGSLLGWQPLGKDMRPFNVLSAPLFDITVQPTVFTADVSDGNNEHNAQYRTNVSLVWTLLDEDRGGFEDQNAGGKPRPRPLDPLDVAFVKLALPFRHDVAIEGTNSFENFRVGVALDAKLTSYWLGGTTFLASVGYDYQDFYEINKELNLFFIRFSAGF